MKSLLRVSFLIPASPAGYPDRQGTVAGLFGSDSLSSPCHRLLLARQPGGVPMGSQGGLDLGSDIRPATCSLCDDLGQV